MQCAQSFFSQHEGARPLGCLMFLCVSSAAGDVFTAPPTPVLALAVEKNLDNPGLDFPHDSAGHLLSF